MAQYTQHHDAVWAGWHLCMAHVHTLNAWFELSRPPPPHTSLLPTCTERHCRSISRVCCQNCPCCMPVMLIRWQCLSSLMPTSKQQALVHNSLSQHVCVECHFKKESLQQKIPHTAQTCPINAWDNAVCTTNTRGTLSIQPWLLVRHQQLPLSSRPRSITQSINAFLNISSSLSSHISYSSHLFTIAVSCYG